MSIANLETHVELKVSDDGRGISAAALKERAVRSGLIEAATADAMGESETLDLIFLPGLTTADKLSMSAGRGVGMNIVRESVCSRNGSLSFETAVQKGTTFTIKLPLAAALH